MRQPASRPGDRDERGRPPESATFEASRVSGRRRLQPLLFVAGFVAVLGAMIAISIGSRGPGAASRPPAAVASPERSASEPPTVAPATGRPAPTPIVARAEQGPVVTSPPGAIQLLARRQTGAMFVHGDVYVPRVTWTYLSLQDDLGNVAGWASVSVPGAAGPARPDGPTLRFDVELPVPERFAARLWLSANAYDADGLLISTIRLEVPPLVQSGSELEP